MLLLPHSAHQPTNSTELKKCGSRWQNRSTQHATPQRAACRRLRKSQQVQCTACRDMTQCDSHHTHVDRWRTYDNQIWPCTTHGQHILPTHSILCAHLCMLTARVPWCSLQYPGQCTAAANHIKTKKNAHLHRHKSVLVSSKAALA